MSYISIFFLVCGTLIVKEFGDLIIKNLGSFKWGKWNEIFNNIKDLEGFKIKEISKDENKETVILSTPCGKSIDNVNKSVKALESYLNADIKLEKIEYSNLIKVNLFFKKLERQDYEPVKTKNIFIGYKCDGKPYSLNPLYDSNIIISGIPGTGKSRLLHMILANLIINNRYCRIYCLQISKKDLSRWRNVKQIRGIYEDPFSCSLFLQDMVKEVESRNKLFAEAGVDSIDEYNKIAKKKMSKIWIVIEEISIFMSDFTDSKEEAKAKDVCFNLVFRLVRTARSSGIGILSVLQRLTVDNIGGNGSIKSLCSIITFKQNNDISSRVAIDSDLATELNQGEIYCNSSQELVKLNVPNIEFEVLKKYIPSLIISKERV